MTAWGEDNEQSAFRRGGGIRTIVMGLVLPLIVMALLYGAFVKGQADYRERTEVVSP